MRIIKYGLLTFFIFGTAMAIEVSYKRGVDYLNVKIKKNHYIHVKSSGSDFRIKIKECNKLAIEKFISNLEDNLKKMTSKSDSPNSVSVKYKNEVMRYSLRTSMGRALKNLDKKILQLKFKADLACGDLK